MPEFFQKGGPLMWLLLLCSVVAVAVFLERAFYLHRASIRVGELLRGLSNLLALGNVAEAVQECSSTPGPAARVMRAVLLKHDLPRTELRDIAQDAGQLEVPKLERNLGVLIAMIYLAPLIGLLGTVIGLIDAFTAIGAEGGYATATEIGAGVYQSLLTTAAGLAVCIPTLLAYQFLSARVNTLLHDMERAGIEVITLLTDLRRSGPPAAPAAIEP
ncbi:MAG TPA: MotA/TolQ/ExbB proton channel family protein [Chthoniobacterales bacterium]|jgi:biopolymer transport protein ExbB